MPTAPSRAATKPRLIIRAPNHLGDLVMSLPALRAARPDAILVRRSLLPLLKLADTGAEPLPLEPGAAGMMRAAGTVRRRGYQASVVLPRSFSSALLFAAAGVRARGEAAGGRSPLLAERVPSAVVSTLPRASAYHLLATGTVPDAPPVPRLEVPQAERARWQPLEPPGDGPLIGLFPGSAAASRRWDAERFGTLAGGLSASGARVVAFGGPDETALSALAAGSRGADLGGRTDLPLLAAGLAACDLVVSNDSGPLHVAAAVGTPTVSFWGAGDPAATAPAGPHRVLRHAELPCVPCLRNRCPRRGKGTVLERAERECLRLITVEEAAAAVTEALGWTGERAARP